MVCAYFEKSVQHKKTKRLTLNFSKSVCATKASENVLAREDERDRENAPDYHLGRGATTCNERRERRHHTENTHKQTNKQAHPLHKMCTMKKAWLADMD